MSSKDGSILLNQVVRDEKFIPEKEFTPVSLRKRKDLQAARGKYPVYWVWEKDHIKRVKFDPIQTSAKFLVNSTDLCESFFYC